MSENGCGDPGRDFPWRGELDAVTGIPPRKALDDSLPMMLRRMGGEGLPLSALMIDIDHFKTFNDKWGHSTGDRVLRLVACSIRDAVRYRGEAFRYGGEEITVLLPNAGSKEAAQTAERIRLIVYNSPVEETDGGTGDDSSMPLSVSISIGVSTFPSVEGNELLIAADQALYQAKNEGRNKVCIYSARDRPDDGKVALEVTFPAASSISEGSYILLTKWFSHRDDLTDIEAWEISDTSKNVREIAEGQTPKDGLVTAEIKGRVTNVERRTDKTFFSFEVTAETFELMFKHMKDKNR